MTIPCTPPLAASAGGLAASTPHEARILIVSPMPSQVSQLEGLLRSAGYAWVCGSHPSASSAGVRTPFDPVELLTRMHHCSNRNTRTVR